MDFDIVVVFMFRATSHAFNGTVTNTGTNPGLSSSELHLPLLSSIDATTSLLRGEVRMTSTIFVMHSDGDDDDFHVNVHMIMKHNVLYLIAPWKALTHMTTTAHR